MALKITDECIACGVCESACPNNAISAGKAINVIDASRCTECVGSFAKSQCVDVCPVNCCIPDPAHEESKDALLARWKELHPGEEPKAGTF